MSTNPTTEPNALAEMIEQTECAVATPTSAWDVAANENCIAADSLETFHAKPVALSGGDAEAMYDKIRLEELAKGGRMGGIRMRIVRRFVEEERQALAALQSPPPVVSGEATETFNGYSRATAERALARVYAYCDWAEGDDPGEDTNPRMCPDDIRTALALVSTPPVVEEGRRDAILALTSTTARGGCTGGAEGEDW